MLTFHFLLVQLARFYQYTGSGNILVIPNVHFKSFRLFQLISRSSFQVIPDFQWSQWSGHLQVNPKEQKHYWLLTTVCSTLPIR
jgi:hypothetical protein